MNFKKLKTITQKIEMTDEMHTRIIKNCQTRISNQQEENKMRKKNNRIKKSTLVVIAASLCLCLTAVVIAGSRYGFFKDIKNWNGAVIGTQYEQATDEIKISVTSEKKEITVCAVMLNYKAIPYSEFETFGIDSYQIVDMSGNVVFEGERTEFFEISDGEAKIKIPLLDLDSGEYRIAITSFVGSKKADQPLPIYGEWMETFTI